MTLRLSLSLMLVAALPAGGGVALPASESSEPPPVARLTGVPLLATTPTRHRSRHYGVNPTVDTDEETLSGFGLDVDTNSWAMVREALTSGALPPPEAVRVESVVNAPGLLPVPAMPRNAGELRVDAEVFPSPFRPGYHALRLTIVAGPAPATPRPRLIVAVSPPEAIFRIAAALSRAVANPEAVSLVAAADPASALERAFAAVDAADGPARLVLAGDGHGGVTPALLVELARRSDGGVPTLVLAVDLGRGVDDAALVAVAEAGGGPLLGPDDLAPTPLAAAMRALVTPTASDVVAQVRFRADAVARFRLLGFEHRTSDGGQPPRGALLGAGQTVTALYEIRLRPGPSPLGAVELSWRRGAAGPAAALRVALGRDLVGARVDDATATGRLALAAAACAEKLRGSFWARHLRWDDVLSELRAVGGVSPAGVELSVLATRAATLVPDADPRLLAVEGDAAATVGAVPILAARPPVAP